MVGIIKTSRIMDMYDFFNVIDKNIIEVLRADFFVMDSIILHIILKVNKLNLFHRILY